MQYEFLKAFPKRMKNVGMHALLQSNSSQKAIWKQLGFDSLAEQLNVVYSVLLYIMEGSLKEEICTLDNIAAFIDSINEQYHHKKMNFDNCYDLADFIVNIVLSNEGRPMYFQGLDYENNVLQEIHINYLNNKIAYDEQDIRRTSYYLTEDGYNLLLGTLEVESNLKLTIQELIFKLHLEKQSYDKALDDVKNIFNLMRIQLQKIQAAMQDVRRNVLAYNVNEYGALLGESLATIDKTKAKFRGYRDVVQLRVQELEQENINIEAFNSEDMEKLQNLREIDSYLVRAIDEYQRILDSNFDFQALYSKELEKITERQLVQRFSLRTELYEKLLDHPECLDNLDVFFSPLFNASPSKTLNVYKFLEQQRLRRIEDDWQEVTETFDAEEWEAEQRRLIAEKLKRYELSLTVILQHALEHKELQLSNLFNELTLEEREQLIPTINIFKEIMVELLRVNEINIAELSAERTEFIQEETSDFRLQKMVLEILDKHPQWQWLQNLSVYRMDVAEPIVLRQIDEVSGLVKNIRCSDCMIVCS